MNGMHGPMVQTEEDEALPPIISLDDLVAQQELKEEPPSTVQYIHCGSTPEERRTCIRLMQRCLQCPVLPAPRPTLSARRALLQLVCDESGQPAADDPATLRLPEPKAAAAAALADLTAQLEQCHGDDLEDQSDRDAARRAEAVRLHRRRKALERTSLPLCGSLPLTMTPRKSPDSLRKGGPSVPATRTLQLTPAEAAAPASGTKLSRASSFGRLVRTGGAASVTATRTLQLTPATAATPAPGSGTKLSRASSFGRLVRKNSFGRAKGSTAASGGAAAMFASHVAPSIGTVVSCAPGCEGDGGGVHSPGSSPQPPSAVGGGTGTEGESAAAEGLRGVGTAELPHGHLPHGHLPHVQLPLAPYVAPGAREAGRAYEVLLCCLLSARQRQVIEPSLTPTLTRTRTRTPALTRTRTLTRCSSPPPPKPDAAQLKVPPSAASGRAASSRAVDRAGYSCRCRRRCPLPTRAAPSRAMARAEPASPPASPPLRPPPSAQATAPLSRAPPRQAVTARRAAPRRGRGRGRGACRPRRRHSGCSMSLARNLVSTKPNPITDNPDPDY